VTQAASALARPSAARARSSSAAAEAADASWAESVSMRAFKSPSKMTTERQEQMDEHGSEWISTPPVATKKKVVACMGVPPQPAPPPPPPGSHLSLKSSSHVLNVPCHPSNTLRDTLVPAVSTSLPDPTNHGILLASPYECVLALQCCPCLSQPSSQPLTALMLLNQRTMKQLKHTHQLRTTTTI
jgi:hypothetical protein